MRKDDLLLVGFLAFCSFICGCASNQGVSCWISESEGGQYPSLDLSSEPGGVYVVEGVYRARFELSRIALGYEGLVADIGAMTALDFCVGVTPECSKVLRKEARPPRRLRDEWSKLARIRVLARYRADSGYGCVAGTITVLKLISVERVR